MATTMVSDHKPFTSTMRVNLSFEKKSSSVPLTKGLLLASLPLREAQRRHSPILF